MQRYIHYLFITKIFYTLCSECIYVAVHLLDSLTPITLDYICTVTTIDVIKNVIEILSV